MPINPNEHEEFLNVFARSWINKENKNKIRIALPKLDTIEKMEYMVFAGLPSPKAEIFAKTVKVGVGDTMKIVFSGKVENFEHNIKTLYRYDTLTMDDPDPEVVDTILKQKMQLKLYYSPVSPSYVDSVGNLDKYSFNFLEIPFEQFEGYKPSHKSIVDNPAVDWYADSLKLIITDLKWNSKYAQPCRSAFRAAVELVDFIVEDGSGKRVIVPDEQIDSAMTLRQDPRLINREDQRDSALVVEFENLEPLKSVQGFTATGSVLDSNWNGDNETRSIFLRWKRDLNPSLRGYEISWHPSGRPFTDTKVAIKDTVNDSIITIYKDTTIHHMQTVRIGKSDNYTITIPKVMDTLYYSDSTLAKPKVDISVAQFYYDTTYRLKYNYQNVVEYDTTIDTISTDPLTLDTIILTLTNVQYTVDTTIIIDSIAQDVYVDTVFRQRRLTGNSIDTIFYKANSFDVHIIPLRSTLEEVEIENWRETGEKRTEIVKKFIPDSALIERIDNISFKSNNGDMRNHFKIEFFKNGTPIAHDQTIKVPLNRSETIDAKIRVGS